MPPRRMMARLRGQGQEGLTAVSSGPDGSSQGDYTPYARRVKGPHSRESRPLNGHGLGGSGGEA
jgi:hypothetical protein